MSTTTTRNLVNFSGIGRGEVRDVRDGELTWNAFIDAIAEKALISGGGHHGYRRGFAVRVYGVRVICLVTFGNCQNWLGRARQLCRSRGIGAREPKCAARSGLANQRREKKSWAPPNTLSLAVQQSQARRRCLPSPWVSATSMPERECPAYRRFTLRRSHRHPGVA